MKMTVRSSSLPRLAALISPLGVLAGTLLLAGCGGPKLTEFAPSCPRVAIRADTADITRYREGSGGRDLTDLVLDGRITGFKGGCSREDETTVRTVLDVDMVLARGPATRGRVLDAAFFVAVVDAGRILDKQVFPVRAELRENQDQARVASGQITMMVPVNKEKSAASYDVLIGFQLTPDELETNRRRGPR
jgi:hypothetical protein